MRLSYAVINPKLVSQSSILAHPPHIRWAWLALIIEGQLHDGVLPGLTAFQLSRLATISIQQAEEALRAFLAPDPFSACATNDGRRLELIEPETNTYRLVSFEFQQGLIKKARDAARKRAAYAESAGEKAEKREMERESPENPPPSPSPPPQEEPISPSAQAREASGAPTWEAVERIMPLIPPCAMKTPPDEQIAGMLVGLFGEDLVTEVFRCRAPDLRGKGWQYARKIMETWEKNPEERPGRKGKRGDNGRNEKADSAKPDAGRLKRFEKYG